MNANRLINMVLRMVMRKGINHLASRGPRQSQAGNDMQSKEARQTAKRARQAAKLTRRL